MKIICFAVGSYDVELDCETVRCSFKSLQLFMPFYQPVFSDFLEHKRRKCDESFTQLTFLNAVHMNRFFQKFCLKIKQTMANKQCMNFASSWRRVNNDRNVIFG